MSKTEQTLGKTKGEGDKGIKVAQAGKSFHRPTVSAASSIFKQASKEPIYSAKEQVIVDTYGASLPILRVPRQRAAADRRNQRVSESQQKSDRSMPYGDMRQGHSDNSEASRLSVLQAKDIDLARVAQLRGKLGSTRVKKISSIEGRFAKIEAAPKSHVIVNLQKMATQSKKAFRNLRS